VQQSRNQGQYEFIKPLFLVADSSNTMGEVLLEFIDDNYNQGLGSKLIDANNDVEAMYPYISRVYNKLS